MQPEKLIRAKIEGFCSIREAEVRFGDVTVLIGANGAGKSNLLGFLQMVGSMMGRRLALYVNEHRGANALLHFGSEVTRTIRGSLDISADTEICRYSFELGRVGGDQLWLRDEKIVEVEGDSERLVTWPQTLAAESAIPTYASTAAPEDRAFVERVVSLVKMRVYHLDQADSIGTLEYLLDDRFLAENGRNLAVMLLVIKRNHPKHYARIVDEMRQVLPEFLDFVLEPSALRGGEQIELRWSSRYSRATMGPDQLSDGSIRAAALITLLLQPDELKPNIVVVDEPELGLHPNAVGQIGRLIAEASVTRQIIVSTQSPRLLSEFEPEQVVVVESENGASSFRHLDSEQLSGWLEEYDLGRLFEMNVTGGAPQ